MGSLRKMAATTMMGLLLTASSFAGEPTCKSEKPLDQSAISGALQMGYPYRLFRAEGEHQCWHRDYIGYKCSVMGVNYTDCQQAFVALQRDNCCSRMMWQGKQLTGAVSNSFRVTKCTNFF